MIGRRSGLTMDIDALSDFRLVALHGGFGKASRASGRPKATLSKRVIDLEASLGVRLFDRASHSLQLTEEGRRLYVFADELDDAINHVRDELSASTTQPRGKIRVAAPSLFTYLAMGDFVASFLSAYPEIEIEAVIVEPQNEPAAEIFDLLIRVNPPPSSELVGRIFGRDTVRVVGSPQAVASIDPGSDGTCSVPAVAPTGTTKVGPWEIERDGARIQLLADIKLHLPSRLVMRDAVCAGFGLAELPAGLIVEDVREGRLIDLGPAPYPDVELWVLYPSRRLLSRRVSIFVSFLCDYFKNSPIAP